MKEFLQIGSKSSILFTRINILSYFFKKLPGDRLKDIGRRKFRKYVGRQKCRENVSSKTKIGRMLAGAAKKDIGKRKSQKDVGRRNSRKYVGR